MRPTTRTALIALALGAALFTQPQAQAQVRVFEDVPSVEQLRAILIPESRPGTARRIELPRRETLEANKPVQPAAAAASTQQPAPRPMAIDIPGESAPAPADAPAAAPEPEQAVPAAPATTAKEAAPATAKEAAPSPSPDAGVATVVGFRINFAFNSAVIPSTHFAQLDQVAELMREEPALSLAVEGHTDAAGSFDYNIELSRRRAAAVVQYLVEHGVEAGRLMAVGKGKTEPLVSNPMDGRNRRVQFVRLNSGATS